MDSHALDAIAGNAYGVGGGAKPTGVRVILELVAGSTGVAIIRADIFCKYPVSNQQVV